MTELTSQRLHVLDMDLPYVASEAAIEIDNLIKGYDEEPRAFQKLTRRLKYSFEFTPGSPQPRYLMDAATLSIVDEAVVKSGNTMADMPDLIERAQHLADKALEGHDKPEMKKDLEWALLFCLALSRSAAAYRRSVFDMQPRHPFRG